MFSIPVVFLVGGDAPTRSMLRYLLEDDGAAVVEVAEPRALGSAPRPAALALLVLITSAPEQDVSPMLVTLRRTGFHAPTLVLTRGMSLQMRQRALALGVVDVIALPLDTRVLQTRLRRALAGATDHARRETATTRPLICAGGLTLRIAAREVSEGTRWTARLTRREALLLQALMAVPGQVVGPQELLDRVWGEDYLGAGAVLKATVRRVRQKLLQAGATRPYVRTVRERGYAFDARATPRPAWERDASGPPRVLVVDDDPATVALIRAAVEEEGYAVTHSAGVDVVALARRFRPVVVLLDINVPHNAGAELRRRLRDDPHTAGIPVIALAASRTLRLHAHEIQANDYLAKPFDADELLLCIGRWAVPPAHTLGSPAGELRQRTERLSLVVPGL